MPMLLGLHPLDALIVVVSLLVVLAIGVYVSRGVKGESDFFVGGRTMGPLLQFFMNFGQATDSNGAPTIATEVYRQGVGGMWIGFQTLFITPFLWFFSIWFRRARLVTGPELFVDRFNSTRLANVYAVYTLLLVPLTLAMGNVITFKVASAVMLKPESAYTADDTRRVGMFHEYVDLKAQYAAGKATDAQLRRFQTLDSMAKKGDLTSAVSYVRPVPFYIAYTLIVAAYITMGGIKAAAITDAFQGILIIVFSVIMIPLGLHQIGGFSGLHATVPAFKFALFGAEGVTEYTWYAIAAIVFASMLNFGNPSGPATAAARDERSIRIGLLGGVFLKRFVMIAWMLCGLIAVALFHQGLSDPDNAWGTLAARLLGPGLMGVMIAGMLLGHMPAVGVNVVNFSATFSRNVYEPNVRGKSPAHYMLIAKLSIVAVLVAGIAVSTVFHGVISLLSTAITIQAFFGVACFLIYFWRKIRAEAIGIGTVIWLVLMVIVPYGLPRFEAFRQTPALTVQTAQHEVKIHEHASAADVANGLAKREGDPIEKMHVQLPAAVFFETVARSDPNDQNSKMEGQGRFSVEMFTLSLLGLPVKTWEASWLLTARWLFDGILPFVMLIGMSYLVIGVRTFTGRTDVPEDPEHGPAETLDGPQQEVDSPAAGEGMGEDSAGGLLTAVAVTRPPVDAEQRRLDRFYAKLKTPVAPSQEEDDREMALTYANPHRFDHLKLFPGTSWEFTKWTKSDVLGFSGCWLGVLAVLAFLWMILRIGA